MTEVDLTARWLERDGASCQQHIDAAALLRSQAAQIEILHLVNVDHIEQRCKYVREIERLKESLARKEDEDFWTGVCESLDMEIACWRVSYNNGKTWTIWETDPQPSMFDTKQGMVVHPLYVPKHCATMKENKHD